MFALESLAPFTSRAPWSSFFQFTPGVTAPRSRSDRSVTPPVGRSGIDHDSITVHLPFESFERRPWRIGCLRPAIRCVAAFGEFERIVRSDLIFRSDILLATAPWVPANEDPNVRGLLPGF